MASLNPGLLINAYEQGLFPMADEDSGDIYWYSPDPRAILPLDNFRISRSLRKTIRDERFTVTRDKAFDRTIAACADRSSTWISDEIIQSYTQLYKLGYAHSVECWNGSTLAGGLYGVAFRGAFFGESMFHHETNASKVALAALVNHLCDREFKLLDIQFLTPHLESFGAIEIPREQYLKLLDTAISLPVQW